MTGRQHGVRRESDVLLRQLDGRLAALRAAGTGRVARADLAVAERVAAALRRLVSDTSRASAADRARVRAAVHFFASRCGPGQAPDRVALPPLGRSALPPLGRSVLLPPGRFAAPSTLAGRRNDRRASRSLGDDVRIVNDILGDLGTGLG